jgi:polysaccharide deacetylase
MHKIYLAIDNLTVESCESIIKNIPINSKTAFHTIPNDVIMHPYIDEVYKISELLFNHAQFGKVEESSIANKLYLASHEIYEMLDCGLQVELHAHMHHPSSNLNHKEIEEDLQTSFQFIHKKFNKLPKFWCLPFGIKSNETLSIATKYELNGIISGPSSVVEKNSDMFNLPRIEFGNNMYSFYKKLSKAYIKSLINRN